MTDKQSTQIHPISQKKYIIILSIVAVSLFVFIASHKIEIQGLYYDELHQVTGAFAYIGEEPVMFSNAVICGIPMMNMNYSGAIKTCIYGLYLKLSNAGFSIASWRLLGILFVFAGVMLFAMLVQSDMNMGCMALFLVLLLTDGTVIITSRHDWGPVALALSLRLSLLGTWIYMRQSPKYLSMGAFFIGAIVGIAIFEKLSSIVLFAFLIYILVVDRPKPINTFIRYLVIGGVTGGSALLFVNSYTFVNNGYLISLHGMPGKSGMDILYYIKGFYDYLALGNGAIVKGFILGTHTARQGILIEAVTVSTLLISACYLAFTEHKNDDIKKASVCLFSYFTIIAALWLLPSQTSVHHWIIGTPFHYLAIVYTIKYLNAGAIEETIPRLVIKNLYIASLVVLICTRLFYTFDLFNQLEDEKYSQAWDNSINKVAEFSAKHAEEAAFIAADWGIGTQILSFSNGKEGVVYELFWGYNGTEQIEKILKDTGKKVIYAIERVPPTNVNQQNTERIIEDLNRMPGLIKKDIEDEIRGLQSFKITKYVSQI